MLGRDDKQIFGEVVCQHKVLSKFPIWLFPGIFPWGEQVSVFVQMKSECVWERQRRRGKGRGEMAWIQKSKLKKNTTGLDFSDGIVDRNPPVNTENEASIPGPGRSHMPPRGNYACASEALFSENPCSTARGTTARTHPCIVTKSSPRWPQLEKDHARRRRPSTAINK